MHTGNSIVIKAPRERIFALTRELLRWPEHLPHYRFVREAGTDASGHQLLEMSAWRTGIPVAWTSAFHADEHALELHFHHVRGWTRGMDVVWTFTPTRDGTRVEIVHDLAFFIQPLAWFAEPIISRFFIHHIAGRTLATFKAILENEASASP